MRLQHQSFWGVLFGLCILVPCLYTAGSSSSSRGDWSVTENGVTCILLKAQIDLYLTYYTDKNQGEEDVQISVPASSTSVEGSTCNGTLWIGGHKPTKAQIMQLTFDKEHLPGWNVRFGFTSVTAIGLPANEYVLLQVNVTANYTSDSRFHIPHGEDPMHTYVQPIDPENPPSLADTIYASNTYALDCPSKQKFPINTDTKLGPKAYIQFSLMKVQAFRTSSTSAFGHQETCPADQRMTDKVPIIVGGCLAGITVLTLIVYLVYRSRLPPDVLHMVNPHSHFENKAISIEDEEDNY